MVLLRSALFNICFYLYIVVALVVYAPAFFLPRRVGWPLIVLWARASLWMLRVIAGIKIEVRGRENIPDGGFIVAAKHQSVWETFALLTLFPDPTFILKRELTWLPIFGWYTMKMKMIPVNRGKRSAALRAMTADAREAIAEGRQILIFPEGTRRPAGAEPNYKFGIVHIYRELKCPVLPVALNSGLFWPRRTFKRYPGTVVIDIRPPIAPGLPGENFVSALQGSLEEATDTLLLEAAKADNPPPGARAIAARIAERGKH
ncbi:1-acyl-sn-glycerol-3-phosphate acyltransferase [Breoghania corrubedonensis]|uniref:1-acyl-sn-glycerol-3-phosphate acyltransferase n=1 Tax=Breoghania corrubedonensis TaxID=665038 RepID=A0A2T5VHU9_9HYPH|nr:1-acyl-sn-glycerol-3-phosphate acyltransferase [Breoghania corrubedonensis]PTW63298.1 1-acyl-sn-glycerol-3-phosphate acyltransferase [Breoghania corrubedonensis]